MTSQHPPPEFNTPVAVQFWETWNLEGQLQTGEQVLSFGDEFVAKTPATLIHWFLFDFDSVRYEFKLIGEQTDGIDTDDNFTAMINPHSARKCWMNGYELHVNVHEPVDEE